MSTTIVELERNSRPNCKTANAEMYKWKVKDVPGIFEWIALDRLHVDQVYQRTEIKRKRVADIAASWSWAACGAICVARREDGTLWVFDGQHRALAARKRGDITELPCLIFPAISIDQEADAYIRANTNRGPMRFVEKFKAMLVTGDPVAVQVQEMLDEFGYIASSQRGEGRVSCLAALYRAMERNPKACRRSFELCVELYDGGSMVDQVVAALNYLDMHLQKQMDSTIAAATYRKKLLEIGAVEVERSIQQAIGYHGKSGEKVWADGIVRLLNKGRRTKRIPAPFGSN